MYKQNQRPVRAAHRADSTGVSRDVISIAFAKQYLRRLLAAFHRRSAGRKHTLNILYALLEDLVQNLGVLEGLLDLGDDGVGQFLLLSSLDLALVANP